jgi:hypothetical protein
MTKRRGLWLMVAWSVTMVAVTSWVVAKAEEVTTGNAMLVGVVAATALTAAIGRSKKE